MDVQYHEVDDIYAAMDDPESASSTFELIGLQNILHE